MAQQGAGRVNERASLIPSLPKWRRGDGADRIRTPHLAAEAIYQRQIGDVEQIIERVRIRGSESDAYAASSYRVVEVRGGKAQARWLGDRLRDARHRADRMAS